MSTLPSLSTCTSRRSYWTLKLYSCAEAAPAGSGKRHTVAARANSDGGDERDGR